MLTENQLRALADPIAGLFQDLEIRAIQEIARHIGEIGKITPTDIHRLDELARIGYDTDSLLRDVAATSQRAEDEVFKLLQDTLRNEYNGYELPNKVGFESNAALQDLIRTISRETAGQMKDFSKTTGFINTDGQWKPLAQSYKDAVDKAVLEIRAGTEDFHGAMRRAMKNLTDGGLISKVDYESGYRRRLDSSIRNAVMGAQQRLSMEQAKLVGEQFGADGMEITWHGNPRPEHEEIGGRQYSIAEYQNRIESLLMDDNCYHRAFPIVLGVSVPAYSDAELEALNAKYDDTVLFEGKAYTGYEATQMQRKLETAIRREKERAVAFKTSGDVKGERIARAKVQALNGKYAEFSSAVNLSVKRNRTGVPGFSGREKIVTPIDVVRAAPPRNFKIVDDDTWQRMGESYWSNANKAQLQAIDAYTGPRYRDINAYLQKRSDYISEEDKTHINVLTRKLNKTSGIDDDIIVYRGTTPKALHIGDISSMTDAEIAQKAVGKSIRQKGFLSTSVKESVAESFSHAGDVIFKIEVPQGTPGASVSGVGQYENEREIILRHSLKYLIQSVDRSLSNKLVFNLRVVTE